jgi:DNA-binding NarL/FixJ family response regulator
VYAVARCQWRLAEALLGAGDRQQATAALRAAHETAAKLRAAPLQAALEALARRGRLDLGAGIPVDRTLAGLTPREVEVLRLLVEGRSNRQIAERLWSHQDRRHMQREQPRSVWSHPGRRGASDS